MQENKHIVTEKKANNQLDRIQQIYGTSISFRLGFTKYSDSKCNFELYFNNMTELNNYKINNKNGIFIMFVNSNV